MILIFQIYNYFDRYFYLHILSRAHLVTYLWCFYGSNFYFNKLVAFMTYTQQNLIYDTCFSGSKKRAGIFFDFSFS